MDEFTPLNLFGKGKPEEKEIHSDKNVIAESSIEETEAVFVSNENCAEETEVVSAGSENYEEEAEVISVSRENCGEEKEAVSVSNENCVEEEKEKEESAIDMDAQAKCLEKKEGELDFGKIQEILSHQKQILEQIDFLNKLFQARIRYTDHEEKVIDQMHKELQKYKEDMYAQLVRPILLDVIEVRDSILRMSGAYLTKPEGEQNIPNKVFADYALDLQDILEKNQVEVYRSKPRDSFEPLKQRIIKKVVIQDETMHGRVAESLSCGYSYKGQAISPEKIAIYFWEKGQKEKRGN